MSTWYVINDTLHDDLNVPYVKHEIKRLGQRYEENPNIATNLTKKIKTTLIKRKLPQALCT